MGEVCEKVRRNLGKLVRAHRAGGRHGFDVFRMGGIIRRITLIYDSFDARSLISILHERHPVAHPTRVRRKRQFAAAIRDKCVISSNGDEWSQMSANLAMNKERTF